jgi:hypothetical protein
LRAKSNPVVSLAFPSLPAQMSLDPIVMTYYIDLALQMPKDLCKLIASYSVIPKPYSFRLQHKKKHLPRQIRAFHHDLCGDVCLISYISCQEIHVHLASANWGLVQILLASRQSYFGGMAVWSNNLLITDHHNHGIRILDMTGDVGQWTFTGWFSCESPEFGQPYDIGVMNNMCIIMDILSRVKCYLLSQKEKQLLFTFKTVIDLPEVLFSLSVDSLLGTVFFGGSGMVRMINLTNNDTYKFSRTRNEDKRNIGIAYASSGGLLFMTVDRNYIEVYDTEKKKLIKEIHNIKCCGGIYVLNNYLFICADKSVLATHLDAILLCDNFRLDS